MRCSEDRFNLMYCFVQLSKILFTGQVPHKAINMLLMTDQARIYCSHELPTNVLKLAFNSPKPQLIK